MFYIKIAEKINRYHSISVKVFLSIKLMWVSLILTSMTLVAEESNQVTKSSDSNLFALDFKEEDPTRIWTGSDYADVIIQHMNRYYPSMPLIIDSKELGLDFENIQPFKASEFLKTTARNLMPNKKTLSEKGPLADRATEKGYDVLPANIRYFLVKLETGSQIGLSTSQFPNQDEMEETLRQWIVSHQDQTLAPHQIMAKSIEISRGHILAAWVIAWNVLCRKWPAAAVRNYGHISRKGISKTGERYLWKGGAQYRFTDPNNIPKGKTQIEFPNDTENPNSNGSYEVESPRYMTLEITKRGDEFSYFYHRVGVELFSMIISEYTHRSTFGKIAGMGGALGESFKFVKTSGIAPERKKRVINDLLAAFSGARLYELVKNNRPAKFSNTKTLSPSLYLKSSKLLYGNKNYLLDDGKPAVYEGTDLPNDLWDNRYTVDELRMRFHHAVRYDSKALNTILLLSTGDWQIIYRGLGSYLYSDVNDSELNTYLLDFYNGVTAWPNIPDVKNDLGFTLEENLPFMKEYWPEIDLEKIESRFKNHVKRVLISKKINPDNYKCMKNYQKLHLIY